MRKLSMSVMLLCVGGVHAMKSPKDSTLSRNDVLLHEAAQKGEIPLLKLLLERRARVDTVMQEKTPLEVALEAQRFGVARLLVASGAPVKVQDIFGNTPLHTVVKNMVKDAKAYDHTICTNVRAGSYMEVINLLLYYGAQCGNQNLQGNTVFHEVCAGSPIAIRHIHCGLLHAIFSAQSPLNDYIVEGEVEVAEFQPDIQEVIAIVKQILALPNGEGKTIKDLAGDYAHDEPCSCFDIVARDYQGDDNTFLRAIRTGDVGLIQLFLERKILDHMPYAAGKPIPLHVALEAGRFMIVGMLLEAGAQVNTRNAQGDTSLHALVKKMIVEHDQEVAEGHGSVKKSLAKYREIMSLLLYYGAEVGARNKRGRTVFHEICSGWPDATKMRQRFYFVLLQEIFSAQTVLHEYYLDGKAKEHIYLTNMQQMIAKLHAVMSVTDLHGKAILDLVCQVPACDHSACNGRAELLIGVNEHNKLRVVEFINRYVRRFYDDE